jgi:hypothetical protein
MSFQGIEDRLQMRLACAKARLTAKVTATTPTARQWRVPRWPLSDIRARLSLNFPVYRSWSGSIIRDRPFPKLRQVKANHHRLEAEGPADPCPRRTVIAVRR